MCNERVYVMLSHDGARWMPCCAMRDRTHVACSGGGCSHVARGHAVLRCGAPGCSMRKGVPIPRASSVCSCSCPRPCS